MERKNIWPAYDQEQLAELDRVNALYKACLDEGKTERECVRAAVRMAQEKGYRDIRELIRNQAQVKTGDKVYAVCMDKSIVLFHIGNRPLEEGRNEHIGSTY